MFYLLNKKKGISSFKAIKEFAKKNNIKKIGHTGTLDPLATGLLLVATDDDTKLIDYIDKGFKTYITNFKLGYISNSYDTEGDVKKTNIKFDKLQVNGVIKSFEKEYMQEPPSFSAKKVNGKRAYELAREGKHVELKSSLVKIKNIKNIEKISNDEFKFELTVSRGTYIRSIINEIGKELKAGAVMSQLERTKIGNLTLNDISKKINVKNLLTIPILVVYDLIKLLHGKEIIIPSTADGEYVLQYNDEIIGIATFEKSKVIKRKLFGKKCERLINESR